MPSLGTIVVALILAVVITFAIRHIVKSRKNGCGCGCSGCSGCSSMNAGSSCGCSNTIKK